MTQEKSGYDPKEPPSENFYRDEVYRMCGLLKAEREGNERQKADALKSIAMAILKAGEPDRRTFNQTWLTIGPSQDEDSAMIRIDDIATIVRVQCEDKTRGQAYPPKMLDRGVEIRLKSGNTITAPEADYNALKLHVMGATI